MLNQNLHESHIRRILASIYTNKTLSKQLYFKGGTCLYLFHELDRFSTDLDFNCVAQDLDTTQMSKLLDNYNIKEHYSKLNTYFWLVDYGSKQVNIKIEASKRDYPDTYKTLEGGKLGLGIKAPCMTTDCMFAHKLVAVTDRSKMANRDLYDCLFMLRRDYKIKEDIIQIRTDKNLKQYLEYLIEYIHKNKPKDILNGLGEVLTPNQKDWIKDHLLTTLLFELENKLLTLP